MLWAAAHWCPEPPALKPATTAWEIDVLAGRFGSRWLDQLVRGYTGERHPFLCQRNRSILGFSATVEGRLAMRAWPTV